MNKLKQLFNEYKEDKMFLIDTIRYEQDLYENIVNEMLDFDLGDK